MNEQEYLLETDIQQYTYRVNRLSVIYMICVVVLIVLMIGVVTWSFLALLAL